MSVDSLAPVHRVAVFRALYLGDMLLAVPAWRALRAAYPQAEITLIGLPWAEDLVRRYPYLDRFLAFPGYPGMPEVEPEPGRLAEFFDGARAYGYDLAFQMHGSGEQSAAFVAGLGARLSVGYEPYDVILSEAKNLKQRSARDSSVAALPQNDIRASQLDLGLPYPEDIHETYRCLRLVEALAGQPGDPSLEFPLFCEDYVALGRALEGVPEMAGLPAGTPLVGVHPGSKWPSRRWMPERFAALADELARRLNARIVLTGGPGEEEVAEQVAVQMRTPAVNLAGRTTLGALAALMARLRLFVANDTGPAHLAAAVGVPSITLFGPGDRTRWATLDTARHPIAYVRSGCGPCLHVECPGDHRCLRVLTVADVRAVAEALLPEESTV